MGGVDRQSGIPFLFMEEPRCENKQVENLFFSPLRSIQVTLSLLCEQGGFFSFFFVSVTYFVLICLRLCVFNASDAGCPDSVTRSSGGTFPLPMMTSESMQVSFRKSVVTA